MRSARILFAATATAAALAITTPGAYALTTGDDWSKDETAHSKERDHDKPHGGMHTGAGALSLLGGDDWSKDHGKDEHGEKDHDKSEKDHDKPHGGMHTGGGALTMVNADDWSKPETETKPESEPETKDHDKDWGKEHDKPKGGMHTGGGGLADTGTNVTGAVVLAGGVAGFVFYRRRKAAGTAA
ncbi:MULTISPECIES: hypothetical protein [unclassified Streptomyces]|uniref:hypothetical protein n=1 Tax=unclassified Streptomyces TaxID=2593676 RepID=UPI00339F6FB7